jgi:hypothetical protein
MSQSQNQRCTQRTQSGRPCNACQVHLQMGAVRGSDPPACAVHTRRSHGFYADALEPRELADLVAYGGDLSLDDEIACARVALRRVLAALGAPGDEKGLSASDFARLAGLAFQGTRTVSRLLRDQRTLSGDAADGINEAIGAALDELSVMWGVEL